MYTVWTHLLNRATAQFCRTFLILFFFLNGCPPGTPTHYIIRILFSSRLYKLDNGVLGNANSGKASPAALLSCAVHQRAQVFTWAVHCLIAKKKEFELYILQPQLLFATRYLFENKLVISSLPPIRASGSFKPMGGSTSLAGPRLQTTLTRHCNGWVREYPQWFPTPVGPTWIYSKLKCKISGFYTGQRWWSNVGLQMGVHSFSSKTSGWLDVLTFFLIILLFFLWSLFFFLFSSSFFSPIFSCTGTNHAVSLCRQQKTICTGLAKPKPNRVHPKITHHWTEPGQHDIVHFPLASETIAIS